MNLFVCSHRYRRSCFDWAQATVAAQHYLRSRVPHIAQPFAYIVEIDNRPMGCCIVTGVHQTAQRGFWGDGESVTKWQVANLARIWLDPRIQRGGEMCDAEHVPGFTDRHGVFRPTTATWLIGQVLGRIQRDRIALWPPVQLALPYHIRMVVSYSDPAHHSGAIYRLAGADAMNGSAESPRPRKQGGKVGWFWRLPEPAFSYRDVAALRHRQVRLF